MTPLEAEEERLRYFLGQTGATWERFDLDNVIQCFKDAYAHELAEKIREAAGSPPAGSTKGSRMTYQWHARRNAAVIDPAPPGSFEPRPATPPKKFCSYVGAHEEHVHTLDGTRYLCRTVTVN